MHFRRLSDMEEYQIMTSMNVHRRCGASREVVFRIIEASVLGALEAHGAHAGNGQPTLRQGDTWQTRRHAGGRQSVDRCHVIASNPPQHLCYELVGPNRSFTVEFRLDAHPGSNETEIACRGDLKFTGGLTRFLSPLVRREVGRVLAQQLDNIVAWSETLPGSPPPQLRRRGLWQRPQSYYKGLLEASAPGMHASAARLLSRHLEPCTGVLDLAAGSGAWLARLRDAGFQDLHAVEINRESFHLADVQVRAHDLNEPFSQQFQRDFQLITALEIMEHLDSPRHFAREVRALLADGGHALFTVPNIGHWAGRLRFLRRGEHIYFEEADYTQRHISPVTDLHMRILFREMGFRLIDSTTAGSSEGKLKAFCVAPIALLFRWLIGRHTSGEVSVYLVAKDRPDAIHVGRNSHYGSGQTTAS